MGEVTLREITERLGGELIGDGDVPINEIGPLATATATTIAFLSNPQYVKQLETRDEQTDLDDAPSERLESMESSEPVELPRGEDIVRQLEEYLRERAADKDDDPSDDPKN